MDKLFEVKPGTLVGGRRCGGARSPIVSILVAAAFLLAPACGEDQEKSAGADRVTEALNAALQAHVEGRTSEAVRGYQEVLRLDPTNKFALYNLGLLSQNAGNNADAEAKYREVLRLDPAYEPALLNLGIIRNAAGDTNEATSLYRRAIAADPNDASAHLNLGLILRRTGNRTEGDAEVKKAIELNPNLTDPASR